MSKRCAKCEKTVYPLEELKCLDKIWHKGCFRCWVCSMALNMKNYKGYDKKPYCNAHYPTTKYTSVAETPEMQRLAQNTKMQSQIKYHEDFEKNIKGTKIQVTDDPESQRLKAATANISQIEYKGLRERAHEMEGHRSQIPLNQDSAAPMREPGKVSDYDPARVGGVRMAPQEQAKPSPMSSKNQGHSVMYSQQGRVEQPSLKKVGSIHDYDPLNEHHGSLTTGYAPASTMRQTAQWEETTPAPQPQNHAPPQAHVPLQQMSYTQPEPQPPSPEPARPEPSYHPPEQHYPAPQHNMPPPQQQHNMAPPPQNMAPPPQSMAPPPQSMAPPPQSMAPPPQMAPPSQPMQPPPPEPAPAPAPVGSGPVYQAMYDYEAQDDDEIGFLENDLITECQPIDEGWMFGTVQRTGKRGMLPANYVERVQ